MKKIWIFMLSGLLLVLSGCLSYDIPEGSIKDFVNNIDFDKAFSYVNSGKSVVTSSFYVDDVLDGKIEIETYIDKNDKYYQYMATNVSGSYYGTDDGDYNYYNQQVLTYFDNDNNVIVYKKTDDVLEDISYSDDDVDKSVKNFFYTELESGYHSGGVYYGDYVKANCGKYYSCFSLDEEKNELTYEVNTSSDNELGQEIVTMHHFVIDKYGMIIELSSKSMIYETKQVIETTIKCEYNIEIEKLIFL